MNTTESTVRGGGAITGNNRGPQRGDVKPAAAAVIVALTAKEKHVLESLEKVIESGLKVFLQVGNALLEIRENRLYRDTHPTFEAYCRERWSFSKTHANRLIQSASVAKNLAPIGVAPTSESQVRALSGLKPADQVKVMKQAVKFTGGHAEKVTAKLVEETAQSLGVKTPQGSAGRATGTRSQASAATTPPTVNVVPRKVVIDAISDWAEEHWEKVSMHSVADFLKAIRAVVAKA